MYRLPYLHVCTDYVPHAVHSAGANLAGLNIPGIPTTFLANTAATASVLAAPMPAMPLNANMTPVQMQMAAAAAQGAGGGAAAVTHFPGPPSMPPTIDPATAAAAMAAATAAAAAQVQAMGMAVGGMGAPSPFVCVTGMVTHDVLADDQEYLDVIEDLRVRRVMSESWVMCESWVMSGMGTSGRDTCMHHTQCETLGH